METLFFEVIALYQNQQPIPNATCTFILGHNCISSSIPTQTPLKFRIDDLNETENLLILFKIGDDIVAKTSKPISALKQNESFDVALQGLDSENHKLFYNKYLWEHAYSVSGEKDNVFYQSLGENPFKGNLIRSPDVKNETRGGNDYKERSPDKLNLSKQSEQGMASFDADAKGFSPMKAQAHESPAKTKVDLYLNVLEAKLSNAAKAENSVAPQLVNLLSSIRSTVNELERTRLGEPNISNILPPHTGNTENSLDNQSPKFGKNQFALFMHETQNSSSRRGDDSTGGRRQGDVIDEVKEDYPVKPTTSTSDHIKEIITMEAPEEEEAKVHEHDHERYEEIIEHKEEAEDADDEEEILNEMGGDHDDNEDFGERLDEGHIPKSVDTRGSIQDEVQIDRNQDFLLEVKSQLATKVLTNLSDGFTRELVMQMSRSKKKVVAVKLKKSIKLRTKDEIMIEAKSYFREGCERKCLHFFQPFTRYLHLFNLIKPFDVMQEKCQIINLDIDFDISPHSKSVVTPSGLIFLLSGKAEASATDLDDSTGTLHLYNTYGQTLIEKAPMTAARRKNFGVCYMSKNLFVVAGIVNGILSNYCERYDVRSNEWLEIAPMNKKLRDVSLCAFNNRYVYQFFGINQFGVVDSGIERYDAVRDKWIVMNVVIPDQLNTIHMPLVTQINEDHMFIFGGRTGSGFPAKTNKGYVLRIEDKRRSTTAEILQTKNFVSGLAGNFSQNHIIAHEGDILFLRESY